MTCDVAFWSDIITEVAFAAAGLILLCWFLFSKD